MTSKVESWITTSKEWLKKFKQMGSLWKHDNNPKRPHALLTSGNHSNGFFNATIVTERPEELLEACIEIKQHHEGVDLPGLGEVDRVVGSAFGAITIAHVMASLYGCRMGFTEPAQTENGKEMRLKRFDVQAGERVLVVEDVHTTGSTSRKTIRALEARGAHVFPVIMVLVNRSGESELDGRKIVALVDEPMPIWTPQECLLCQQGSEAIRPKGNWDKLNANY